jgi:DNA processing protein
VKDDMQKLNIKPFENSINATKEILAYEALWKKEGVSFKKIADQFKDKDFGRISDHISISDLEEAFDSFKSVVFKNELISYPKAIIKGTLDYPKRLLDAEYPVEVLYYEGDLNLLEEEKLVAIVGTRNPSKEGVIRAKNLVKEFVKRGFTIVSGMAQGIDTVAHTTALNLGAKTIAVLGTPINQFYPKENIDLQKKLMKDHLVVSQVPYLRYNLQNPSSNRFFFPERNKTMSALTWGTVIVEAGETSGTLIQARAAIHQKRKLFILNSCFENQALTWPNNLQKRGAVRVVDFNDISNLIPQEWY